MAPFGTETDIGTVVTTLGDQAAGKVCPSEGGMGAELAFALAQTSPALVILVGRNASKITPIISQMKSASPELPVDFVQCDLSSNASVRKAGAAIAALTNKIDVLVNNAGVMALRTLTHSTDGNEMHLAANHLGHFLLTATLVPELKAAGAARVINVTSQAYELDEFHPEDPNFEKRKYTPWVGYGQSKAANVLHAWELSSRHAKDGIQAFAVHPGYVPATRLQVNNGCDMALFMEGYMLTVARNGGKEIPPPPERSVSQAAATILQAALDPTLNGCAPALLWEYDFAEARGYCTDPTEGDKMWSTSEKLVGLV